MIEGIKVFVSGSEVAELATKKAKANRVKSERIRKAKEAFGQSAQENGFSVSKFAPADTSESLDSSAAELEFIASHVDKEERYLLERSDLYILGINE